MACATCWKWSESAPRDAARAGSTAMSFSAGSGTPMMPVEEGKTSSGGQPKIFCGGRAGGARGVQAGLPRGAVGVAGIDGDNAHLAAGGAQVFLVHNQRRGGDAVGGEGGGGAGRRVGDDEGKVGAAALFEPGLGCAKTKAARERKFGMRRTWWLTHLI